MHTISNKTVKVWNAQRHCDTIKHNCQYVSVIHVAEQITLCRRDFDAIRTPFWQVLTAVFEVQLQKNLSVIINGGSYKLKSSVTFCCWSQRNTATEIQSLIPTVSKTMWPSAYDRYMHCKTEKKKSWVRSRERNLRVHSSECNLRVRSRERNPRVHSRERNTRVRSRKRNPWISSRAKSPNLLQRAKSPNPLQRVKFPSPLQSKISKSAPESKITESAPESPIPESAPEQNPQIRSREHNPQVRSRKRNPRVHYREQTPWIPLQRTQSQSPCTVAQTFLRIYLVSLENIIWCLLLSSFPDVTCWLLPQM